MVDATPGGSFKKEVCTYSVPFKRIGLFPSGVVIKTLDLSETIERQTTQQPEQYNWSNTGQVIFKDEDRLKFERLKEEWYDERRYLSSFSKIFSCPSYLSIIAMEHKAIPYILADLRSDDPEYWFDALTKITGEDPVPDDVRGNRFRMAKAWITWAEKNENF